jgi:hypothetical protein
LPIPAEHSAQSVVIGNTESHPAEYAVARIVILLTPPRMKTSFMEFAGFRANSQRNLPVSGEIYFRASRVIPAVSASAIPAPGRYAKNPPRQNSG